MSIKLAILSLALAAISFNLRCEAQQMGPDGEGPVDSGGLRGIQDSFPNPTGVQQDGGLRAPLDGGKAPYGEPTRGQVNENAPPPPQPVKKKDKGNKGAFGATAGVADRTAKTSVGLTDRTAKTGVGLTDRAAKTSVGLPYKAVKETFKAVF